MEGEEIGMVLARASELRSKFSDFIDRFGGSRREDSSGDRGRKKDEEEEGEEEEEEEEAESLINIRDALESLEKQLSSLQALQQQQRYERESSLLQIDRSRMLLLNKLKEYKGNNLEVISEALTFAGGTLEHDDDLLLPPYPSHLPDLFVLDDLYSSSRISSKYKLSHNGLAGELVHEARRNMNGSEEKQCNQPTNRNKPKGIRFIFGLVAKSVFTFVGVVSVLSLAGFKPILIKESIQFKVQELLQRPACEKRWTAAECPPRKVLLIEDGKPPRLVKERAEVPFDLDVTSPKISYGFG